MLKQISIENFRNIKQAEIELSDHFNFFCGNNGAGKTSFLEAVAFLARGKSFRTRHIASLINSDSDYFQLIGKTRANQIVGLRRTLNEIVVRINRQPVTKLSDLARLFPVLVITPRTHELIERGPENRRHYLDWGLFHVEHEYSLKMQEYRRALKQHNASLTLPIDQQKLWQPALIKSANEIDASRKAYLSHLQPVFEKTVKKFADIQDIHLDYSPGWKKRSVFADQLQEKVSLDRSRGYTSVGPHRADVIIRVAGAPARERLSRGQQKIVVSALILSQAIMISHKQNPIILIDDLPAELDAEHQENMFGILAGINAQKIVASIDPEIAFSIQKEKTFHVEHGFISG
jgi:DNA replication and repair protein RecF